MYITSFDNLLQNRIKTRKNSPQHRSFAKISLSRKSCRSIFFNNCLVVFCISPVDRKYFKIVKTQRKCYLRSVVKMLGFAIKSWNYVKTKVAENSILEKDSENSPIFEGFSCCFYPPPKQKVKFFCFPDFRASPLSLIKP